MRAANIYLEWQEVGARPAIWKSSPKQHDAYALNIEDIAFRSNSEMIFGLRAPLSNRTDGNAYYFIATNWTAFLPTNGWTGGQMNGLAGPYEMNLAGLGFRSIKWCPNGLTNAAGANVARYLVLAGNANGGPLQREATRQKFTLYSWDGNPASSPQVLIEDMSGYAIRPEGLELISVNGEWRVMFAEDRFTTTGYGTRNVMHWPVSILGPVN